MDERRSSIYPNSNRSSRPARALGFVGLVALSILGPGCHVFDTERELPPRGSVGEEMFGVICDRVGAQALHEDLSGASFREVCHKPAGGQFADKVDQSRLPPILEGLADRDGNEVPVEKQTADREYAIVRIEALARRRSDVIRALDATFPATAKIALKDLENPDPTKTCDAPKGSAAQGRLVDRLAGMLGRMGGLYDDGTLPHSTRALATVVQSFADDEKAQLAWQRVSARQGYRPIETALGTLRPIVAYPNLRDFSNASLRLLSADSQPYQENPKLNPDGSRIPIAGPGNMALNKLLEIAHEELLAVKAEPAPALLTSKIDSSGRVVISRPRDNVEMLQELLYREDDAFKTGGAARFIVRRDPRGYARIRDGLVPAPFIPDPSGLPAVDEVGRFNPATATHPPAPSAYPGAPTAARDEFGRATVSDGLLFDYIDTSRTFAAQMLKDLKPLVNSNPDLKHETLMDMAGGLPIVMGPRVTRSKQYGKRKIEFDGIKTKESPMLDLVYALGVVLGDKNADAMLSMTKDLFTVRSAEMARVTAAMSEAFDLGQQHAEASIPRESTFWDENIDVMVKIAKEPGLLEDVLYALRDPQTQRLGTTIAKFASFKDKITYDPKDINGPTYNLTTKSNSEMRTPVDRNAPITGDNRSALYRFLSLVSETTGVTACNKEGAKVHAAGVTIPFVTYRECEVFKIENLGAFYVDSIANAASFDAGSLDEDPLYVGPRIPRGTIYMRPSIFHPIPNIARMLEDSSGIVGFWAEDIAAPKPRYLNRLVFFDFEGDRQNEKTRSFIADLQGERVGGASCPERIIDDPSPGARGARRDGKVRGLRACADGQWLNQRDKNSIFTLENFGFYDALQPLAAAFAKHRREDLFLELSAIAARHYPGKDASEDECRLPNGKMCPRDGAVSYEGAIADAFATDVIPALGALVEVLEKMPIRTCTAADSSGACTTPATRSALDIVVEVTRTALDPDNAKRMRLTDRNGNASAKRNDGTTIPQTTPAYLLTNALHAIDLAFDKFEAQNPVDGAERRAGWRRARSQLVDQFLGTTGGSGGATFANPTIPKMTPAIVDMLRAQLWAHCPRSFVPPYERCAWARDELVASAEEALAGPMTTAAIDVLDAIQHDPDGRRETERLLEYLLDTSSKNDALASLLASTSDIIQLLRDDENLVPLLRVVAGAVDGSKYDQHGRLVEKSLVDAQMALLARLSGKYVDRKGDEICAMEVDPEQVMAAALTNLVTPIRDASFKGQAPLEVLIDVIADVNRDDPRKVYTGILKKDDYASVSRNVVDFLTNPESGLEQFYEVIRNGTP